MNEQRFKSDAEFTVWLDHNCDGCAKNETCSMLATLAVASVNGHWIDIDTAAEIGDGLGYGNPAKDWQNAAMVAKVWPDGDFALAPLIFLPNPDRLLTPDGRRYLDKGDR